MYRARRRPFLAPQGACRGGTALLSPSTAGGLTRVRRPLAGGRNDPVHGQAVGPQGLVPGGRRAAGAHREAVPRAVRVLSLQSPPNWGPLVTRVPRVACRWYNHLNPDIRHDDWTPEEDAKLLEVRSYCWGLPPEGLPAAQPGSLSGRARRRTASSATGGLRSPSCLAAGRTTRSRTTGTVPCARSTAPWPPPSPNSPPPWPPPPRPGQPRHGSRPGGGRPSPRGRGRTPRRAAAAGVPPPATPPTGPPSPRG